MSGPQGGEQALASKQIALRLRRGDVMRYRSAGGGWGPPGSRAVERMARDGREGCLAG
jgi:N-methylhydantoinase B/oxoprolinase/acetone carboxylase alpha subunit